MNKQAGAILMPDSDKAVRLLLADDDAVLRDSLREQLEIEDEYCVEEASDGRAAIETCKKQEFDLVILDLGLADADGREVFRHLRASGYTAPIILLTNLEATTDSSLDAYSCVIKPFKYSGLRRMIHDLLAARSRESSFAIGPWLLHPSARTLTQPGAPTIRLTDKEVAILLYLSHVGDVVTSRDVLLHEVWGYNPDVTTHTVETHVYRLRQKIEPDPSRARILLTETGGYRLAI